MLCFVFVRFVLFCVVLLCCGLFRFVLCCFVFCCFVLFWFVLCCFVVCCLILCCFFVTNIHEEVMNVPLVFTHQMLSISQGKHLAAHHYFEVTVFHIFCKQPPLFGHHSHLNHTNSPVRILQCKIFRGPEFADFQFEQNLFGILCQKWPPTLAWG